MSYDQWQGVLSAPASSPPLRRKAWEDSSASYSGVSRAGPWWCMLGFTACGGGGSVEVYVNFIFHARKAVKIGKDSVTWMWLPGTGEVIAAELRRVGWQRVLLPSPDRFVVSTGLTLLPLAQKFSNSIGALGSLVKKKKYCFRKIMFSRFRIRKESGKSVLEDEGDECPTLGPWGGVCISVGWDGTSFSSQPSHVFFLIWVLSFN